MGICLSPGAGQIVADLISDGEVPFRARQLPLILDSPLSFPGQEGSSGSLRRSRWVWEPSGNMAVLQSDHSHAGAASMGELDHYRVTLQEEEPD